MLYVTVSQNYFVVKCKQEYPTAELPRSHVCQSSFLLTECKSALN